MLEISKQLDKTINNWINHHAPNLENIENGIYISEFDDSNSDKRASKIWIFEYNNSLYLSLNKNVKEDLLKLIKKTPRDFLFSDYGKYEISKITHDYGYYVWGPTWELFAEEKDWIDINLHEVEILSGDEIKDQLDFKIFWHNYVDCVKGFVIKNNNKIIAAATLLDIGGGFVEIGVDADQSISIAGLGSTVYSAAGRWAFENDIYPYSAVGPWNIPSTRTQLKCGMKYIGIDMSGIDKFSLSPQTLGYPRKDIKIYDYYPEWAFNKDITKI
jgi:RimJ/RimL family protein N-acetyltransferase